MLESDIKKVVTAYAKKLGWGVLNIYSGGGYPDKVFWNEGVVVFIEFKRPKKTPRILQEYRHREMRSKNINIYVVDDIQQGKNIFDKHTKLSKAPTEKNG